GGGPASSVVTPAGTYYVYFRVVGVSSGTDSLVGTVTSPQHNPDTAYTAVNQGTIPISSWPSSLKAGDSVQVTLYAADSVGNSHYVLNPTTFTLAPNANIEFRSGGAVISQVMIPADQSYVQFYI